MALILDDEYLAELTKIKAMVEGMEKFVADHQIINYIEFDYYTVHDITLFSIEPDFDFQALDLTSKEIQTVLNPLKRIFSKPIIHLKDNEDVLPVESVHIINQKTMLHVACHSENVTNIGQRGITPSRLLTRVYEDNYGIYENIVFCNYVDDVLKYAKKNMRSLRDIIYASHIMEFNLLERANHINYYLALGKLHTGYIRDFDKYFSIGKILYERLKMILDAIEPRLKLPVYKNNRVRNHNVNLRKTNIFLNQKDYHKIYNSYRYLLNKKVTTELTRNDIDIAKITKDYFFYVETLLVFALGHFNFETDNQKKMDLLGLDITFSFKEYQANIKNVNNEYLLLTISKDVDYKILLYPSILREEDLNLDKYKEFTDLYEIIVCTPVEDYRANRRSLFVSMESIESFRRFQQLILKAIIYADYERKVCPFCGGDLIREVNNKAYECNGCHLIIKTGRCPRSKQTYFYTTISNAESLIVNERDYPRNENWLYHRKVESLFYFRNITKINNLGQIICPYCCKVHKN